MKVNWQMYVGALSPKVCETIIEEYLKLPEEEATTFCEDGEHRKSTVRWVDPIAEKDVSDILLAHVNRANANAFNIDIQSHVEELQFTEYKADSDGKYDWHHDVDWQNSYNFDRKLSIVVQLSDPDKYSGGKFEFREVESPRNGQFQQQGTILVFPSYLQHRITEVTRGTRYSLVSWIRGPKWR